MCSTERDSALYRGKVAVCCCCTVLRWAFSPPLANCWLLARWLEIIGAENNRWQLTLLPLCNYKGLNIGALTRSKALHIWHVEMVRGQKKIIEKNVYLLNMKFPDLDFSVSPFCCAKFEQCWTMDIAICWKMMAKAKGPKGYNWYNHWLILSNNNSLKYYWHSCSLVR